MNRTVLIVGGGIGGLTAALCLCRKGLKVKVFEQADRLDEVGAGIQLSPNATRVLHYLGLESALEHSASLPQAVEFRDWRSGRLIASSALGETATSRFDFPYFHIHRRDLLDVLANALHESPEIEIFTSSKVNSLSQDVSGVEIRVENGVHRGDALIGADGIHSVTREYLFGAQPVNFTGCVAWRMVIPSQNVPEGLVQPNATSWWGPGKHFVCYFIAKGKLVNCVCVVEKADWEVESWTEKGTREELRRDFAGWHSDIQSLIDSADSNSLYKWALHDRTPMRHWYKDSIALLGDACHATLPFMAQGAAMAIEDAAVVAACLAHDGSVRTAFSRYENLRQARTTKVQALSRRNARVFHLRGVKAWVRDRIVKVASAQIMDELYKYNALEVGESGSS